MTETDLLYQDVLEKLNDSKMNEITIAQAIDELERIIVPAFDNEELSPIELFVELTILFESISKDEILNLKAINKWSEKQVTKTYQNFFEVLLRDEYPTTSQDGLETLNTYRVEERSRNNTKRFFPKLLVSYHYLFKTEKNNDNEGKKYDIELTRNMSLDEIRKTANDNDLYTTDKDEIESIGAIYDRMAPFEVLRKSNKNQSNVEVLASLKNEVISGYYINDDSSGFDDIAILRAILYYIENDLTAPFKVKTPAGSSRSVFSTATRNVDIAKRLVDLARMFDVPVDIGGDIRGSFGAVFVMLVELQSQAEWLGTANTNHYAKHHTYLEYFQAKRSEKLDLINEFGDRELSEIKALVAKNGDHKQSEIFMKSLIAKSGGNCSVCR